MRALHVIPSLSPSQGGPSFALPAMARALAAQGVEVDVATTDDDGPGKRLAGVAHGQAVIKEGFRVFYFPKQTEFYKVSLPLRRWLRAHVREYDVVHVHTVFSFATLAAGRAAARARVPFIVRPLGVLNRWGMENRRRWLKSLSFQLLDKPVLDKAAALHFTSEQERDEAAALGIQARPVVLPLGIDLGAFGRLPLADAFRDAFPMSRGRQVVLFLSRLDPKKNVEGLLEAFARLSSDVVLAVAGAGEPAYESALKQKSADLGLTGRVAWTGRIEGDLKLSAMAAASVFVLPSHSENFGIALLEAMAAGLPCVSTLGVALAAESEAVVKVAVDDTAALAREMARLLADAGERARLGAAVRREALDKYSMDTMGGALRALYEEVRHAKT